MEIGYAAAVGVSIFATQAPSDLTLRQYVQVVPSLGVAMSVVNSRSRERRAEGILIDPRASVEQAHNILERIGTSLMRPTSLAEPAHAVHRQLAVLQAKLSLPARLQ
jgi:hypothetical protein